MANSATYGDTADMQSTGPLTEFPDNRLATLNLKDTNPKDSVGIKKPRFYTGLPMNVLRRVTTTE